MQCKNAIKGNGAVYKELLLLGNVTIKEYFSREHSERMWLLEHRTLASIRSFAVVRAVLTYLGWFSILAASVSTDKQEKERKKTDRA